MSEFESALSGLASTLVSGTAPGKPKAPFVPRFVTGTVSAVSAPTCSVTFAGSTEVPDTVIDGLHYLLGRTPVVGDTVLVLQLRQTRIVVGAIS